MTLLLGFSAVNTGNNLIYFIVASLLGFMAVSGIAGWLNIRGVKVEVALPEEVYCNRSALASVRVSSRKRFLPSFLLEVKLGTSAVLFPLAAPSNDESRSCSMLFTKRGDHPLGAITLSSRFPINFFVRSLMFPADLSVLVFPEPLKLQQLTETSSDWRGLYRSSSRMGHGGEMQRIRPYSGAESLKTIHWRLSARHDDLMVKEFEALSGSPVLLELDAIPGFTLEERLSRAAYLVNLLCRSGRAVGVRGVGLDIEPASGNRHRLSILRGLALYGSV